MEGYPDSGNPEDYTEEQLDALNSINEEDKTKLTKSQKAAIARWKFQKAKAAREAAGGAPSTASAAGAAKASAPETAAKPAAAAPAAGAAAPAASAEKKPAPEKKGPSAEEKAAEDARKRAKEAASVKALEAEFGDRIADLSMMVDIPCVVVKPNAWREVVAHARTRLGYSFLNNLTAADYPPDRMEVVLTIQNLETKEYLSLKSKVGRESPSIQSLVPVFAGANWLEREVYDMFGIRFEDHPDMRRLLLPETWSGFPLRKDYDLTREQFVSMTETGDDSVSFKEDEGW